MELRFPEWEKVINEDKLHEVRSRLLARLEALENELRSTVPVDRREEINRVKKAFEVVLQFQDELLKIKEGLKNEK